jgi:hypothetical protein
MMQREGIHTKIKERGGASVWLMKPKILYWNVRGLDEEEKRMRIREPIREWKADIVAGNQTRFH